MAEIGKKIRTRREQLGLTQEDLASKLGYKSKTTIAKIENGTNDIVQSKVVAFAAQLETTPAYLMGWETEDGVPLYGKLLSMPKDEIQLIHENSYENLVISEMKKMNQKGKVRLLETAREMTCNPLYNNNYEIEVNAANSRTDIDMPDDVDTSDDIIMDAEEF